MQHKDNEVSIQWVHSVNLEVYFLVKINIKGS
jgi:hypothetical protein